MKKLPFSIGISMLFFATNAFSQVNVFVNDIHNFYQAFDSIQTTKDTLKQKFFLEKYYFEQGTSGLKKFIEFDRNSQGQNISQYTNAMLEYLNENKSSLMQKRPWAESALKQKGAIEKSLKRYRKLYPEFIDGDVVFVMGRGNVGGRPLGKDLLIGAELMATDHPDWGVMIVLHEYTHTQQWIMKNAESIFSQKPMKLTQILANALWEGNADHISEIVYGKTIQEFNPKSQYVFGLAHEKEIWEKFKEEMFTPLMSDQKQWFMQQDKDFSGTKVKDIGYFMGHQICKKYYDNAKDKKKAIADMINLKLDSDEAAFQFLLDSGYPTSEEKTELTRKFLESKKSTK